jgi:HEAT repeat protein
MIATRRVYVALVAAGVVLGLVAACFLVNRPPENEVYNGKSLKQWAMELSSPDQNARQQSVLEFTRLGSNAVPGLIRLLETKDSLGRKQAWALVPRLPRSIRPWITRNVTWPNSTEVRVVAARGLAAIGPEAHAAVPALARALRDKERQVSLEAATALGRIGKDAVPELLKALDDGDGSVRHAAAYALGEVGADAASAAPALVRMLAEPNDQVRASAAYSLSRIGAPALAVLTQTGSQGEPPASFLTQLLTDKSPAVRKWAAGALGRMGTPTASVLAELSRLLDDEDVNVRATANAALIQLRARKD